MSSVYIPDTRFEDPGLFEPLAKPSGHFTIDRSTRIGDRCRFVTVCRRSLDPGFSLVNGAAANIVQGREVYTGDGTNNQWVAVPWEQIPIVGFAWTLAFRFKLGAASVQALFGNTVETPGSVRTVRIAPYYSAANRCQFLTGDGASWSDNYIDFPTNFGTTQWHSLIVCNPADTATKKHGFLDGSALTLAPTSHNGRNVPRVSTPWSIAGADAMTFTGHVETVQFFDCIFDQAMADEWYKRPYGHLIPSY